MKEEYVKVSKEDALVIRDIKKVLDHKDRHNYDVKVRRDKDGKIRVYKQNTELVS